MCATTSSRYFFAFVSVIFLIADAVTQVFLKCTRRSEPDALQDFVELSGSREYFRAPMTPERSAGKGRGR